MQPWQVVLMLCGLAVTGAIVVILVALTRVVRRTEHVLVIVEQELRPLIGQVNGLTEDLRTLTREGTREVERVGEMTDRLNEAASGIIKVVGALGALTRAGQLVGLATGIRKGVDVFMRRMRQGDHHG
jgi:uncharacterized protein YoxC